MPSSRLLPPRAPLSLLFFLATTASLDRVFLAWPPSPAVCAAEDAPLRRLRRRSDSYPDGPVLGPSDVRLLPRDLLTSPPPRRPVASESESESESDCRCHPTGPEGEGARMAYLIVVHDERTLSDALSLYRAIRAPSVTILLHLDTKFPDALSRFRLSPLGLETVRCPCGSSFHAASLHASAWGEWSMNLPTLWAMERLVRDPTLSGTWDVFVNLSGDARPVLAPAPTAALFGPGGPLRDLNFVTSRSTETGLLPTPASMFPPYFHKRRHYGEIPVLTYADADGTPRPSVPVEIHFGSQWMSLTSRFVQALVGDLARPDSLPARLRGWLTEGGYLMADETFFATVLAHQHAETLPRVDPRDGSLATPGYPRGRIFHLRYERMDEHGPRAFGYYPRTQRYLPPGKEGGTGEAELEERIWGPYFLGAYDLEGIRQAGALWVRKVSEEVEETLGRVLPVQRWEEVPEIGWPKGGRAVAITKEVPDLERLREELREKAQRKEMNKEKGVEEGESSDEEEL